MSEPTFVTCPRCDEETPKISAACKVCGAARKHRDCYPEQYEHALVGKRVRVEKVGLDGVVLRVVSTRWGLLAHLDTAGDIAYRVADCVEV